jgi:hypothetical protein
VAGGRPRPRPGSARSGRASGTRLTWSPEMQPELPGQPSQDILERSPGRWSPSRLVGLPRWLLMMIAALALAGGVAAAIVAHGDQPGRASLSEPEAPAVGQATTCSQFVKPHGSSVRESDCLLAGKSDPARLRLGLPTTCLPAQVQAGHRSVAVRSGTRRRRCYPVMPGTGHASWPRRVIISWRSG